MILNYRIIKEELIDFHIKNTKQTLSYRIFITLVFILYLPVYLLVFIATKFDLKNSVVIFLTVLLIFTLFFKNKLIEIFKRFSLNQLYKNINKKHLFLENTLELNDNGVEIINSYSNKKYKWNGIKELYILDKYIFITFYADDTIIIPNNSMDSENNLNLLIELFEKNLSIYPQYVYSKDIPL